MIEGILKGLVQWIYGLFLDLLAYCANALLGVMSTDLTFFENSVPIVPSLYQIFVAVGWGLLIGNMAFQSMKAMFAGFGIETESPYILMLRTFLFGTLLIFSKDICDIGLSISKNVIDLLGIPDSVTLTMPTESFFTGDASWLLVIIIGFILGFQLIKLFFEIAERYVVVAVLTLLMPIGLAMGGSKSTKDICSGYVRMYASMLVLMVTNVLFLKLILSALAAMPSGVMVLPWCLLVVGLAKTARKTDSIISRIGMNPAMTGDPLGRGRGLMTALIVTRTIMAATKSGGRGRSATPNTNQGNSNGGNNTSYTNNNSSFNPKGSGNMGGSNVYGGGTNTVNRGNVNNSSFNSGNVNSQSNSSNNMNGGGFNNSSVNGGVFSNSNVNNQGAYHNNASQAGYSFGGNNAQAHSTASSRFGAANYNSVNQSGKGFSNTTIGGAGTGKRINTNRFGIQKDNANTGASVGAKGEVGVQQGGTNQIIQKSETAVNAPTIGNRNNRFGSSNGGVIKHNPNPIKQTGKDVVTRTQGGKAQNTFNRGNSPQNTVSRVNTPQNMRIQSNRKRFGNGHFRRIKDDDILISRDDDNDV